MRAKAEKKRGPPTIVVRQAPGKRSRALVQCGPITIPAAIGRSGRTARKREGDGATPIAAMSVLSGFVRGDRVRALPTALPMRRIRSDMLWCDEPGHPSYNRLVKAPFKPSHEEMKRADGLYDVCLVLDWNISSRRRNRGSAIFFHLIRPGFEPTAGCVAVELRDMRRLMKVIQKGTVVKVIG
ncbi:L,D-transpeptidase family protein [Rhizobiales bacterium RZME27]|uniref:L,D-transpeptidase family protein n=1 Tax=Endobacterium cereale TaxID=2663029 RepID=A0A6A8AB43_9HYPH|nr:L,D-transpeptidase family protein [Endobacterium cereale]MEB2847582.1 L,D-transpeptidase family protein [Endobacterium cereale]MQY47959.1 L,D-transpeptidase family protein [Endobacterium cereale]